MPILLRYWKQTFIVVLSFSIIIGAYIKGRLDCSRKIQIKTVRELETRYIEVFREQNKLDSTKEKITKARNETKERDKLDSCLLSGDPFTGACLK